MKKLIPLVVLISIFTVLTPVSVDARSKPKSLPATEAELARAKELTTRLEEIKAIDKSTLSSSEKRALRMEVRAIKEEMQTMGGGVYISIGALLIIVLLILLL